MRLRIPLILIGSLLPAAALAGLGQSEASIETDRANVQATANAWTADRYRVHELTTPEGTRIREFVANDQVFAVAWEGPFMPNLQVLLGAQFSALRAAAAGRYGDHSQLHVQTPTLVFHSTGHLRAFRGQAYLPTRVPAGVDVQGLH
jgi:hypothetical protein